MLSKKVLVSFFPLVLVFLIAFLFRYIWLDKIPTAIGGDEIVYTLNAKASFITGHDIFGTWSPVNGLLFQYPKGEAQAELPYILNSFFVGPTDFSLFVSRVPNLIMGVLLVLFIFLVTRQLLGKNAAVFAALVASINPWLIYIGRTAYEATPAMLFYFISFYILLKAKGWLILLAFPFLVAAFYSYIATKLIFLPFVFIIIIYAFIFINKRKYLKQYLALFTLCLLFLVFFIVFLKLNPQTARLDELLTPFDPAISQEVDSIRKTSIQNPLLGIFVNKYTIFANIVAAKTLKSFSFDYLFVYGDEFFSIWRHGLFYYIDSIFLMLGALFLFTKKRSVFFLFLLLALLGVVPQVFHTADVGNFSIHMTITIPFLIILIGFGIEGLVNYFKNKNYNLILSILVLFFYFLSTLNFANIYFFWHPLQGYFDFPIRVVSSYALRSSNNQNVTVYSNSSFDLFKKYLFYSNSYNKNTAKQIANNLNSERYTFGNVTFASCNSALDYKNRENLVIADVKCSQKKSDLPHLSIARLKDGGESFRILHDRLCREVALNRYPSNLKVPDFDIENLPTDKFCQTFITSL